MKLFFWSKKKKTVPVKREKPKKKKATFIMRIALRDKEDLEIQDCTVETFLEFIKLSKEKKEFVFYHNSLIRRDEIIYVVRSKQ